MTRLSEAELEAMHLSLWTHAKWKDDVVGWPRERLDALVEEVRRLRRVEEAAKDFVANIDRPVIDPTKLAGRIAALREALKA